jgi:hypothetical protein
MILENSWQLDGILLAWGDIIDDSIMNMLLAFRIPRSSMCASPRIANWPKFSVILGLVLYWNFDNSVGM